MDARCRVDMLGGLRVVRGGREITRFSTQKTGALLAYLAYHRDQAHPREVVAEILWPGRSPRSGRNSLNTALSSLRRQLEPPGVPRGAVIRSERQNVRLNPEAVATDVIDFESSLQCANQTPSPAERLQHLSQAAELYHGELLPGYYEDWVLIEQRKLADEFFEAALSLTALLEQAGDVERAIDVARDALSHDPLREEAHGELMRLYAAAGRPAVALRQYGELRELLEEELGRSPWPATEELARKIKARPSHVPHPSPALRPRPTPLPTGTVTFLLTDIEGSTALFERMGEAFTEVLETHHSILRQEFRGYGAEEIREAGDGFIVPFPSAGDAAACAVACQTALAEHDWPEELARLRVRMALYTGDVKAHEGDYRDVVLHRASRVLAAGHGGQILCSETTAALLRRDPHSGMQLADLGIYRLRDLPEPEKLFQVTYPEMAQRAFPPIRAEAGYAGNLPLQLTRFFGREQELAEVQGLLTDDGLRLLTLTGPGGSGKTRLALEAAEDLVGAYNGAVWFVPLADLRDADLIPGAIADALGLPRSPQVEPLDQVGMVLSEQSPLLILDNLEQFGGDAGPVVHDLLDRVRSATCLATSRQRLDLPGEREYLVPPLPSPDGGESLEALTKYDSVRLFVDRAQAARPDFQLTEANAEAIATLCDRLDGIPLAIELAAARAQVLTPNQMVAQLDHRFDFLVSRRRVTEERHKTLEAAIDWSYRLLEADLQRFFCSLSVFRGGWTLEAAEAICQEPKALDYLEQLREHSLILTQDREFGTRFRMLETLREYGRAQLQPRELSELRSRHGDFFVELAEQQETLFRGPHETEAHQRLEADHDNLRSALQWSFSAADSPDVALRLCAALGWHWYVRGPLGEARSWVRRALESGDGGAARARARVLQIAGMLAHMQGDLPAAREHHLQALELCRELHDRKREAQVLDELGNVAIGAGDCEGARGLLEESLALRRELGDLAGVATSLSALGHVASVDEADYDKAVRLCEESLRIRRPLGDLWGIAWATTNLGLASWLQGRLERARACAEESLALRRQIGDQPGIASSLLAVSAFRRNVGEGDTGIAALREALGLNRRLANPHGIAGRFIASAVLANNVQAVPERSARLLGAAQRLCNDAGVPFPPWDLSLAQELRDAMGDEAFEAAYAEGGAMTLDEAIAYALSDEDEPPERLGLGSAD